jgi:O-antigen/teichoic acid export membrane protein
MILRLQRFWSARAGDLSRGSLVSLIVNGTGLFVAFALQVSLARLLSDREFGLYSLISSWLFILLIPATFGIDLLAIKLVPVFSAESDGARLQRFRSFASRRVLVSGCVIMFVFAGAGWVLQGEEWGREFVIASAAIPLWAMSTQRLAFVRGMKRSLAARAPEVLFRPVLLIVAIWFFSLVAEVRAWHALCLLVAAHTVGVFLAGVLQRKYVGAVAGAGRAYREEARTWSIDGLVLACISGAYALFSEMDKLLMARFGNLEDVGFYTAAARLAGMAYFGSTSISVIAGPLIAEYAATRNRSETQALVGRIAAFNFALLSIVLLILLFGGKALLRLYGPSFEGAAIPLLILSAAVAFDVLSGPTGFFLSLAGKQRQGLAILLISLVINLCLNIPLISHFGMIGGSIGTGMATVIRAAISWAYIRKVFKVDASVFSMRFLIRRSEIPAS